MPPLPPVSEGKADSGRLDITAGVRANLLPGDLDPRNNTSAQGSPQGPCVYGDEVLTRGDRPPSPRQRGSWPGPFPTCSQPTLSSSSAFNQMCPEGRGPRWQRRRE